MSKKSRDQLLPPLTPQELEERDFQERILDKQLHASSRGDSLDVERAIQAMRSYLIEIFKVIYPAYRAKHGYEAAWLQKIVDEAIHRVLITSDSHLRYGGLNVDAITEMLEETLREYLRSDNSIGAPSDLDLLLSHRQSMLATTLPAPPLRPPVPPDIQAQMDAPSDDPALPSLLHSRVAAYVEIKKLIEGPKVEIPEALVRQTLAEQYGIKPEEVTWEQIQFEVAGLLQQYPAICLIPAKAPAQSDTDQAVGSGESEIQRRDTLLAEYKQATGASNKQIYEAKNSGIHKPEFYDWLKGKLPVTSATATNFERFLREKKPPVSRVRRPE